MRFRVLIEGEHGNGLEYEARFQRAVDLFVGVLRTHGFFAGVVDATLNYEAGGTVTSAPSVVVPVVTDDPSPAAKTDAELLAAIKAEKAVLGGNKILSQAELAKRLGVTRSRIRKVLAKKK